MINYSWELNSHIRPDDYLDFGAPNTDTRSEWVRPNLRASLAAPYGWWRRVCRESRTRDARRFSPKEQAAGDLFIGFAFRKTLENFLLASGETLRMRPSRGARQPIPQFGGMCAIPGDL